MERRAELDAAAKAGKAPEDKASLYDSGMVKFISILASLAVLVVNSLLVLVMRRLSGLEQHATLTDVNVSVAVKLTIARFLNSSLVLLVVNMDSREWFKNGNLAYDATVLIGLLVVQAPVKIIVWPWGLIKKVRIWMEKRKGDECKLTQREANLLMEGTTTDVANSISEFINMIMTCLFYSPILPQAIPGALIGTFLSYWALKYQLLRRDKMPDQFSDFMATFFANLMPYIVMVQAGAYCFFMFMT